MCPAEQMVNSSQILWKTKRKSISNPKHAMPVTQRHNYWATFGLFSAFTFFKLTASQGSQKTQPEAEINCWSFIWEMKIQVSKSEDREKWGRERGKKCPAICHRGVPCFTRCEQTLRMCLPASQEAADGPCRCTASQKRRQQREGAQASSVELPTIFYFSWVRVRSTRSLVTPRVFRSCRCETLLFFTEVWKRQGKAKRSRNSWSTHLSLQKTNGSWHRLDWLWHLYCGRQRAWVRDSDLANVFFFP